MQFILVIATPYFSVNVMAQIVTSNPKIVKLWFLGEILIVLTAP